MRHAGIKEDMHNVMAQGDTCSKFGLHTSTLVYDTPRHSRFFKNIFISAPQPSSGFTKDKGCTPVASHRFHMLRNGMKYKVSQSVFNGAIEMHITSHHIYTVRQATKKKEKD